MSAKKTIHSIPLLLILIWLAACTPVTQEPRSNPGPVSGPATPTPEVFHPLDPSPTPADSDLPLTCQVTDLNVLIDRDAGYCFAYPVNFSLGDPASGLPDVVGPERGGGGDPLRASLSIEIHPVPQGSSLAPLVDAFLASLGELPWLIERTPMALGGEPALQLEPVPGLGSARVVFILQAGNLFSLRFHPVELEPVARDLQDLYQTVLGSFTFLPEPDETAAIRNTLTWTEFGETFGLSYSPLLAPWVIARTAAAVPPSSEILYAEAHPANVEFVFYGFNGGRPYDLPLFPVDNRFAQVKVFRVEDFPGYGDDHPAGFTGQLNALRDLLAEGIDPSSCEGPYLGERDPLPYLPWINMAQAFCSQPQIIRFEGGQGIRYITQFSQGFAPVLDREVFYAFQGLTDDGRFYVAAFFPVSSMVFPTAAPPCPECSNADYDLVGAWAERLAQQLIQLNALPGDGFTPALALLDELVASIRIGE